MLTGTNDASAPRDSRFETPLALPTNCEPLDSADSKAVSVCVLSTSLLAPATTRSPEVFNKSLPPVPSWLVLLDPASNTCLLSTPLELEAIKGAGKPELPTSTRAMFPIEVSLEFAFQAGCVFSRSDAIVEAVSLRPLYLCNPCRGVVNWSPAAPINEPLAKCRPVIPECKRWFPGTDVFNSESRCLCNVKSGSLASSARLLLNEL